MSTDGYFRQLETTVCYNPDNVFQVACALCIKDVQACDDTNPRYVTSNVVVFGYNEQLINKLLSRGFKNVYCFADSVPEKQSVVRLTYQNFDEHIKLNPCFTHRYVMDIIMTLCSDDYTGAIPKQDAIDFYLGLGIAIDLDKLVSWDGIQKCDELIRRGKTMREYRERMVNEVLATGAFWKDPSDNTNVYVVNNSEFRNDIAKICQTHLRTSSVDMIIIWYMDYASKSYDVTIVSRGLADASKYAKKFNLSGNQTICHGKISAGDCPLPWGC